MSDILQRLIAHPESFSIPEIQHGVEDGTIPALAGMMAIQAIQKRQAGAQARAMGPQPTVASSMGINMLPTNDTMPQGMAGGGIVAFAGDTDGSLVRRTAYYGAPAEDDVSEPYYARPIAPTTNYKIGRAHV